MKSIYLNPDLGEPLSVQASCRLLRAALSLSVRFRVIKLKDPEAYARIVERKAVELEAEVVS